MDKTVKTKAAHKAASETTQPELITPQPADHKEDVAEQVAQTTIVKVPKSLHLEKSAFTQPQLLKMLQKTPSNHIYRRPAKGGGEWEYVTGTYVKKVLNYVFGWMWSTEVMSVEEKHGQVVVRLRLTILKPDGTPLLHKEDFGKKDIAKKKDGTGPLDYGNDVKAAETDALKRCAAQFGIASDIYGGEEFREIQYEEKVIEIVKDGVPCDGCGMTISKDEAELSKKINGGTLCRGCAKERKQKS